MALSPEERSLRGQKGANKLHALYNSRELTAPARAAYLKRFYDQTDPSLPEDERFRRAEYLLRSHMAGLSLKAATARRKAREARERFDGAVEARESGSAAEA